MTSLYRALATLLLVGALVTGSGWSAAWAQEGDASGEVDITEEAGEKPKAEEKADPKTGPMKMPKPKLTDRDPFRNPILSGEVESGSIPVYGEEGETITKTGDEKSASGGDSDGVETVTYSDEEEEEIEPPAFEISGIVTSGSGRRAILAGPESTHIVSVGDKLAEFKVASISDEVVVLKYKDREFKVEIADEYGLRD